MNERKSPPPDLGPDLLTRYLGVYMQSRQMSDMERPWGLGDDALDALWTRLTTALNSADGKRLNAIVEFELTNDERERIIESLAPMIFALPLRTYPAELRAFTEGERLILVLSHMDELQPVGHLPAALAPAFAGFLRRILRFGSKQRKKESIISSMGRRRSVSVTMLPGESGATIQFLERLPSHAEEA